MSGDNHLAPTPSSAFFFSKSIKEFYNPILQSAMGPPQLPNATVERIHALTNPPPPDETIHRLKCTTVQFEKLGDVFIEHPICKYNLSPVSLTSL